MISALAVGVLVSAALAWARGYWGLFGRLHYSLVALSALTFVALLVYYNLIGLPVLSATGGEPGTPAELDLAGEKDPMNHAKETRTTDGSVASEGGAPGTAPRPGLALRALPALELSPRPLLVRRPGGAAVGRSSADDRLDRAAHPGLRHAGVRPGHRRRAVAPGRAAGYQPVLPLSSLAPRVGPRPRAEPGDGPRALARHALPAPAAPHRPGRARRRPRPGHLGGPGDLPALVLDAPRGTGRDVDGRLRGGLRARGVASHARRPRARIARWPSSCRPPRRTPRWAGSCSDLAGARGSTSGWRS